MSIRRRLTSLISISLAITLIITTQASPNAWNTFINSSKQWTRSVAGLFQNSKIGSIASAEAIQNEMANWQNWPSSFRLKYFDGGWIMPFDLYDLQPHRPNGSGNDIARVPVFTDINGDGLVDMLFSSTKDLLLPNTSPVIDMQQYIALNNGRQFNLVYKCRYGVVPEGFKYFGDCADTAASQTPIQRHPPRFPIEMILHHEAKLTPVNKSSSMDGNVANSFNIHTSIATPVLEENCNNKNGLEVTSCDRSMPRLMDLNGDGLQDIVLNNMVSERYTLSYPSYAQRKQSMVLYNNGNGFDLDHLCYEIADINKTGGSLYSDLKFGSYSFIPSQLDSSAQTYFCLLGN